VCIAGGAIGTLDHAEAHASGLGLLHHAPPIARLQLIAARSLVVQQAACVKR